MRREGDGDIHTHMRSLPLHVRLLALGEEEGGVVGGEGIVGEEFVRSEAVAEVFHGFSLLAGSRDVGEGGRGGWRQIVQGGEEKDNGRSEKGNKTMRRRVWEKETKQQQKKSGKK